PAQRGEGRRDAATAGGDRHREGSEMKRDVLRIAAFTAAAAALLLACSRPGGDNAQVTDGTILARVNGSAVTEGDIERMLRETVGDEFALHMNEQLYENALRSVVISRAMAQRIEPALTADERRDLDARVAAYREQLLVQEYMRRHARPVPVTEQMIREYYEAHPDRFGGGKVHSYELLYSSPLTDVDAKAVLDALRTARDSKDWKAAAAARAELPIDYRSGNSEEPLDERLRNALRGLRAGEAANPLIIEGRAYLLRVTGVTERAPEPL